MSTKTSTKTSTKKTDAEKPAEKIEEAPAPATCYTSGAVLHALVKATSKQSSRPILRDIQASVSEAGRLSFCATDSYRIAVVELDDTPDQAPGKEYAGAAGRWNAADVQRIVKASDLVRVTVDAGAIALEVVQGFRAGSYDPGVAVPASTLEGGYPDWRQLVNTAEVRPAAAEAPHLATLNAKYLADACAMAAEVGHAGQAIEVRNGGGSQPVLVRALISEKVKKTPVTVNATFWYLVMPMCGLDGPRPAHWLEVEKAAGAADHDKQIEDLREKLRETRRRASAERLEGANALELAARKAAELEAALQEAGRTIDRLSAEVEALRAEKTPAAEKIQPEPEEAPEKAPEEAPAAEAPATLEQIAAASEALAYWRTPLCEWIAGDTKPHAEDLRAAGAHWSAKKGAWYRRIEQEAAGA